MPGGFLHTMINSSSKIISNMGGIITQTFWKRKNKKGLFLTYFFYEKRSEKFHVTVIKNCSDHGTGLSGIPLSVRACFSISDRVWNCSAAQSAVRKNKQTLEDQTGNLKCIVGAARVCGGWWIARYGRICTDQSSQKTGSELRFRCRAGNAGMESVLSACRGTLRNTERLCRTLCFLLCANALAKMPDRCGTKVDELFDRLCERFSGRLYDLYCHYGLYDPDPCRLSEYPKKSGGASDRESDLSDRAKYEKGRRYLFKGTTYHPFDHQQYLLCRTFPDRKFICGTGWMRDRTVRCPSFFRNGNRVYPMASIQGILWTVSARGCVWDHLSDLQLYQRILRAKADRQ